MNEVTGQPALCPPLSNMQLLERSHDVDIAMCIDLHLDRGQGRGRRPGDNLCPVCWIERATVARAYQHPRLWVVLDGAACMRTYSVVGIELRTRSMDDDRRVSGFRVF